MQSENIIYNVTVKVDAAIAKDWLQWMLQEHIPDIIQTGCFTTYKVVQLLEVDDTEGPTYAIQYHAANLDDYERYIREFAARLRKDAADKWGDRFIAFRSVMKVIK